MISNRISRVNYLTPESELRERAQVDESTLVPAWMRYTGLLYEIVVEASLTPYLAAISGIFPGVARP